jgi:hypothetical protein
LSIIEHPTRSNHYGRRFIMLFDVVSARHIKDYELEIEFEDGSTGVVDFSEYCSRGGVFEKFNDPAYFTSFAIDKELGVISWAGGVDIAPESLYAKATGKVGVSPE